MDSHVARERYFRSYLGIRYRHLNRTGTSSKPASVRQRGQSVGLLSRILLTLPETVASGGCSFSKLKLRPIKNTLRAMMAQNGFAQGRHFSLIRGPCFPKIDGQITKTCHFYHFSITTSVCRKNQGRAKGQKCDFLPFFYRPNKFCLSKNKGGMPLPPK